MIPLHDNLPRNKTPWIRNLLILSMILIFAYQSFLSPFENKNFINHYAFTPRRFSIWVFTGWDPKENIGFGSMFRLFRGITPLRPKPWTTVFKDWSRGLFLPWISYQFLHASLIHISMNLLFFSIFASAVESFIGRFRFFFLFLAGGIFSCLIQYLTNPMSPLPLLGASGSIAAVLGFYFLSFPKAFILCITPAWFLPLLPIPAWFFLGLWFLMQISPALSHLISPSLQGGVAWWAHIGGFLFGLGYAFQIKKRK